jgi:MYXO-CTERM domain-containing protein
MTPKAIVCALVLLVSVSTSSALADVRISEALAWSWGLDYQDFIELRGPGGTSLDTLAVVSIEGDWWQNPGRVDRVWALDGYQMPEDGYFVLGDRSVPNVDLVVRPWRSIENGTQTIFLLACHTLPQKGMDLDVDNDQTLDLPLSTFGDVLDGIGFIDAGPDFIYGDVPVFGPDGCRIPAGVFAIGGEPRSWGYLDPCGAPENAPTPGFGPTLAPEPAGLTLLAVGAVAALRRRRQDSR